MARVVAVGSAVLDRVYALSNLPEPDGGAFVRSYAERAGGVAANVACALAALDHDAAVVSRVGRDDAGDRVLASLDEWGVDADGVRRGGDDTSYTLILRSPGGDRMIVAGGDSVPGLRLADADRDRLREADCVFTSAYAPDPAVSELVALRERGELAALAFDLAGPLSELDGRGATPATIDAAAAAADLFVANEVAARSHLDRGPAGAAERLREAGADRVAVTEGADGAHLASAGTDGAERVPAERVDAVDTTGAGDAFTAALIHAWVLGDADAATAGRVAARAAAQNCTSEGARGALPALADLPENED
ncbi:carbohydrate kinase family protein [Halobacterium yunchengense]|uniref:carbohydrate kinase family protein n=1 Tax=Halobacterium yunchengense TaxID=3108497 RepID=UPI00300BE393